MDRESFWSAANRPKLVTALAELLEQHDQRKGDLSYRAEGTCEAVVVLAGLMALQADEKQQLADAIVKCFRQYNQVETIGRGAETQTWPNDRFASAALNALGFKRPVARMIA